MESGAARRPRPDIYNRGRTGLNNLLLKPYVKFQGLSTGEEGQDLVEYALLLTLISLALITSIGGIATAIIKVFTNVSNSLA